MYEVPQQYDNLIPIHITVRVYIIATYMYSNHA